MCCVSSFSWTWLLSGFVFSCWISTPTRLHSQRALYHPRTSIQLKKFDEGPALPPVFCACDQIPAFPNNPGAKKPRRAQNIFRSSRENVTSSELLTRGIDEIKVDPEDLLQSRAKGASEGAKVYTGPRSANSPAGTGSECARSLLTILCYFDSCHLKENKTAAVIRVRRKAVFILAE